MSRGVAKPLFACRGKGKESGLKNKICPLTSMFNNCPRRSAIPSALQDFFLRFVLSLAKLNPLRDTIKTKHNPRGYITN